MERGCGPHANCSDKRLLGGAGKLTLHPAPPGRGTHTHTVTLSRSKRTWEGLRRRAAIGSALSPTG